MATTGISLTAPLKEDDGELELGLSLSIGRSYKKAHLNDTKTGLEPVVSGLAGESARRSLDAQMEVDARAKREVQALRRQEAKRKREEKRLNLSKTKLLRRGGGLMTVNLNLSVDGGLNGAPGGNVRPVVAYLNGGDLGLVHNSERKNSSGKGGSCGFPAAVDSSTSSGHRRCTSSEGGNMNDMKSHVSQSGPDQPPSNGSKSSDVKIDCKCSDTSEQVLHPAANGGTDLTESKTVASNASSPSLNGPSTEAKPESAQESPRNHVSFSATPIPGGTRHVIGDRGRPPKPQSQSNAASALSSMPCVSTTGNGPNGKTVNGFLYRYATTEEVSIICICHGTSFSPAEFVQHAGSTDVSSPLRHITMVASAF